jgi:hypothetical protein
VKVVGGSETSNFPIHHLEHFYAIFWSLTRSKRAHRHSRGLADAAPRCAAPSRTAPAPLCARRRCVAECRCPPLDVRARIPPPQTAPSPCRAHTEISRTPHPLPDHAASDPAVRRCPPAGRACRGPPRALRGSTGPHPAALPYPRSHAFLARLIRGRRSLPGARRCGSLAATAEPPPSLLSYLPSSPPLPCLHTRATQRPSAQPAPLLSPEQSL